MATTITPATGSGVLLTQQGTGASPGYAALDFRRGDSLGVQEGVYNAGDFMVVQRAAGANLSVDIGMPAGGFACVQGDTIGGQGLYVVPVHSTTINETIAAANATNPRVDSVILEVQDSVHDGSGGNLAQTRVLTGTPTASTNLTSRAGAPTLPGNALLLADVLVGASATTVPNTVIRDRRKWARGAYTRVLRTAGSYTTTLSTLAQIDSTNLQPRIECSGAPVRVSLRGRVTVSSNQWAYFVPLVDGFSTDGNTEAFGFQSVGVSGEALVNISYDFVPTAGSHLIGWGWKVTGAATLTLLGTSGSPAHLVVEEMVRQNTANNTTTTG